MKIAAPYSVLRFLFCSVFILGFCSQIFAQEKESNDLADFLIKIEATKSHIKLNCVTGCDWKELHYTTTTANLMQAINRSGMTDLTEREILSKEDSTDFIFIIERTNIGLTLKGLEGIAWKELSFNCPEGECTQLIDQMGMSKSK